MLKAYYSPGIIEAGCDEAGRGCLAGPVFAAAVVLPSGFNHPLLNDSKMVTARNREILRIAIEKEAVSWAVSWVDNETIDRVNILNASIMAMHRAVRNLKIKPELLLVDGNRFHDYTGIKHVCVVDGDAIYRSIAAASILAKTHRDKYMEHLHMKYPQYAWLTNKGYPTEAHRRALVQHGLTEFHRRSFNLGIQLPLFE